MLINEILRIGNFIVNAFLHIWPYLLVTIPLAVAVQMSGASKYIKRAFQAKPFSAIILATIVGAFSPFCSCGVIPVIASLLISGVPLAPVMSFWIASPSMDPEIFLLSVGMIGWDLAVWRLAATLFLSLNAGVITHIVMARGLLNQAILCTRKVTPEQSTLGFLKKGGRKFKDGIKSVRPSNFPGSPVKQDSNGPIQIFLVMQPLNFSTAPAGSFICRTCSSDINFSPTRQNRYNVNAPLAVNEACCNSHTHEDACSRDSASFRMRLLKETFSATWMVGKFMALAFLLEGLITLYIPENWISGALGSANPLAIITAAFLGVPAYTTSLTALPMISGLLTQGMNPAAALSFLIAGPITTLPAMAAVWPLVARRVFILYVSFTLVGAVLMGYFYNLIDTAF